MEKYISGIVKQSQELKNFLYVHLASYNTNMHVLNFSEYEKEKL
jgi:hypothetical protein